MQRYTFSVRNGRSPPPEITDVLSDHAAAQEAARAMFVDLARDTARHLTDKAGWQVSVSDETGKAFYRISVAAESLR
jgi:hypothetical protein